MRFIAAVVVIAAAIYFSRLAQEDMKQGNDENQGLTQQYSLIPICLSDFAEDIMEAVVLRRRRSAAKSAARSMNNRYIRSIGSKAAQLQNELRAKRPELNTDFLSTAQVEMNKICTHAEIIKKQIQFNCDRPELLKALYRKGVIISCDADSLAEKARKIKIYLSDLSETDPSLKPLYDKANGFYLDVYVTALELDSRNLTLRMYIANNFGYAGKKWSSDIDQRAQKRKAG